MFLPFFSTISRYSFLYVCKLSKYANFSTFSKCFCCFGGLEPKCLSSTKSGLSQHWPLWYRVGSLDIEVTKPLGEANDLFGEIKIFPREANNSLRGANNFLREANNFLREANNSLRRANDQFLREANKALCGANTVFCRTNNPLLRLMADMHVNDTQIKSVAERLFEQMNIILRFHFTNVFMKTMPGCVNQYYLQRDICTTDKVINKLSKTCDDSLISISQVDIKQFRPITKCNKSHRHSRRCLKEHRIRGREPSRISLKKTIYLLKSRKMRKKYRKVIKNNAPQSSVLNNIYSNYKHWMMKYVQGQDSFYSKYYEQSKKPPKKYNSHRRSILLSGDVEMNPGPRMVFTSTSPGNGIVFDNHNFVFQYRLLRHNLEQLDVGGGGDCFFKSVSHQLYGNSMHHLEIRAMGVSYLREYPDHFIDSITHMPWPRYLANMSLQGTWADHVVIQAVAEAMNLKINIIESSENFSEITIVEQEITQPNQRSIFIGHIGEMHYVSTREIQSVSRSMNDGSNESHDINLRTETTKSCNNEFRIQSQACDDSKNNKSKNRKKYMKQYMKKYRTTYASPEKKAKCNEYLRNHRKANKTPEQKAKENEYQRNNRKANKTPEKTAKRNEYLRNYRKANKTPEKKAKKNQYQRNYRKVNMTSEKKEKQNEYLRRYRKDHVLSIEDSITKYHQLVIKGPLYICTCCDQLWYKHSVVSADKLRQTNPDIDRYLYDIKSVDNKEWVCKTCHSHLIKNKLPPCAIANDMAFPQKPDFFDLNELECRLLAPRIAFQKLMQAPRGKQLKIHGNIVNVPADVNDTVRMLPRLHSQSSTIKINLKRKLQYKSSALSLNVRPYKVVEAAKWLINNSKLYRDEGVQLDREWISKYNVEMTQDQMDDNDCATSLSQNCNEINSTDTVLLDDNESSEDEGELPAGTTDTMLTPADFVENNEHQHILNVAPAEGNRPLSVFRDKYSEELAYPGIFVGQARLDHKHRQVKVNYSDICKSELRRSDRRAAMCVENIFYKTKKLQMKILLGKSNIALRKCKGNNRNISAAQLKQEGAVDKLIKLDEGYKFLNALRGSPPYFEKAKRDLFAMIRQLGRATLFCSFSSAETHWLHLLRILGQLVDHQQYSDEQLENFNWEDRCRLIQSDPVTCARHFDYQVNQFMTKFLLSTAEPLGKISDWFYRVEYQQRGSPHIHMLIWLEGAPRIKINSDEQIATYIDNIITGQKPTNDDELTELVNTRQIHRHSHTCRKHARSKCRFNYPQPPLKQTMILYPLDNETPHNHLQMHKDNWTCIKKYLDDMIEGEDITFDQLLYNLNVTEENYLLAIRSSLNAPTVFLKRNPNELRVNNYNPACLKAWRANMDIQFVLDVYACAVYIVNYISKGQKGMSELLRQACTEARQGNLNVKQQVRDIGSKFVNNVEISAQEAVYIVLQLPMRKASRQIIFINTSPPDERVELLKPIQDIKEMDDDSEEIYTSSLIKRYSKRPAKLENLTLADWAAWYDNTGKTYVKQTDELDFDGLPLESFVDDNQNDDDCDLKDSSKVKTKKRAKARIIRSVWFNKESDPEKHYRELLMLFTSWRNEETDFLGNCSSYQERCTQLQFMIKEQMKQYAVCNEDFNDIQHDMSRIEDMYDSIAPCAQSTEREDESEGNQDLHPDFNENYNLSDDLGIPSVDMNTVPLTMNELPDDEYRTIVQMLNKEQKEFFYHVLHLIKTSDEPFYCFLSGGAGVGKSHVTKALYQAAIKYYNTRAGVNFAETKVLMLAPTGKAAYNIKGNTIHSALAIPASQSLRNYKKLDSSRLNTLRSQIGGVKLIFIDEISMVGNTMFNVQINTRLKDIKGSSLPFGGVSIIAIGDLFQLQPVMDGYIFKDMDNFEYGILAPNIWQELFKMFELKQIMRQRESKQFAEMLNRLREGKHTSEDIMKFKERIIEYGANDYPKEAPHLFIQNAKVNKFNCIAHNALPGIKHSITAHDSVIGAESQELRDKILQQVPNDPRKTKQLHSVLKLAVGERTEISLNTRTDDGMTNGAGNVIKLIQIHQTDKPSGIIWVQFDHLDVGLKTRHDNRQLYAQGIEPSWTPIKPVTTQFAVGRNRTVQVVRKQFPLRPAAAKTIHRSQGDTETKIVVNFETKRTIPHIHYVGLSRVTTIEGLYITELYDSKIAVSPDVQKEMERLRNEGLLKLCISPIYNASQASFKFCSLNARSLHKHIDDIRKDLNFSSTDISFFYETRFSQNDSDLMYSLDGYSLFRNDDILLTNTRPYRGTAVYTRVDYYPGYPQIHNVNGIEITVTRFMILPHVTVIGIYRPPGISIGDLCSALRREIQLVSSQYAVFIGDFNVNWFNESQRRPIYDLFISQSNYKQLVKEYTTDNKTCIDHIYTNLPDSLITANVTETYFTDHKTTYVLINLT